MTALLRPPPSATRIHWKAIRAEFGYAAAADRRAAETLRPSTADQWQGLQEAVAGTRPTVLCCGPSLAHATAGHLTRPLVCADGATTHARALSLVPDVVVTDLDGPRQDLLWAARHGAWIVVHAHGDNDAHVQDLAPRLARASMRPLLGTCQCDPPPPLQDLGGFTDGDRAVLLCRALGAAGIRLVAFEPHAPPGPYSHRFDPTTKPRKLAWAARIVDAAAADLPIERITP